VSASGTIDAEWLKREPELFVRNAIWQTYIAGTRESRFGGRLLDPAPSAGGKIIAARGWGDIERKASKRFMPQSRDYSQLAQLDSEPLGASGDGFAVAESISADVKRGRIVLKIDGSGQDPQSARVPGRDSFKNSNGVVFFAPGVNLTRIAFTLKNDAFSPGTFEVAVMQGPWPRGPLRVVQQGSNPYGMGVGGPRSPDLKLGGDDDMVAIVLRNETTGFQHVEHTSTATITNLRINGIGLDDHYPASAFITEVFGRMGLRDMEVDGNDINTLPYDLDDNAPWADALDYANLLTGWRHRVVARDGQRFAEWGPWGPIWDVPEGQPDDLVPMDRYDAVRLAFRTTGGGSDEVMVIADDAAEEPVEFSDVTLVGEPTRDKALDMAQAILGIVGGKRLGGGGELTTVRAAGTDVDLTAHVVQAGDILRFRHYDNLMLRVQELRRTDESVAYTAEERIAALDRLVARYNQRQHQAGKY